MKTMVFTLLVAVLLCPITGQSQPPTKAPNFILKTSDGKTVELKKLLGKVVVVNFWATWCGPCKAEIPGFLEVYKEYKPKGLEIVGISLDQSGWKPVKPFVDRYKITYPIVVGDANLAEAYGGIEAIPTTFIVDKKGNIAAHHVGYMDKKAFEDLIKGLL